MAKRRRQQGTVPNGPEAGASRATESAVLGFAEDLGRILGVAQGKAEDWLNQRKAISDQLAQIRDTATKYLQQITEGAEDVVATYLPRSRRRGRPPGSTGKRPGPGRPPGSGKKKRTMSATARQAISDAQKRRWAKQKKASSTK
jgi:hypothetical protein